MTKSAEKENNTKPLNVQFIKRIGVHENLFSYNGQQIIVKFTDTTLGIPPLQKVDISNGYIYEYIVYCNKESNDERLFSSNLTANRGQYVQYNITLPQNCPFSYYPFIIWYRRNYKLDNDNLPIIIPIFVARNANRYNSIYIDQYQRSYIHDRI